jgi:alpha-beta hydrolase superfamily lysophospholipase
MVARGFAIVMTDYQGLGTPGLHTYIGRVPQGNAMLDAARAAKKLPDTSLDPEGPLAFWGYSQGGGAAASAAELASSYAPELKVVGTYAGAPPADLKELFPYADEIRATLTPRGEDMLFKVADQCVAETLAKFMFRHLQPYFKRTSTNSSTRSRFPACSTNNGLAGSNPMRPSWSSATASIRWCRGRPQTPRPRLVWTGCRRSVLDQRRAAVPEQGDHQPRVADAR